MPATSTWRTTGPGDLKAHPDPVPAGGTIEIEYRGPGRVTVSFDFGEEQEVPIDPETGKGKVKVPPGASIAFVMDSEGASVQIDVVQS